MDLVHLEITMTAEGSTLGVQRLGGREMHDPVVLLLYDFTYSHYPD
ncbi:unnamed protein product, partial [Brassica oleracea var. botrytis]